MRFNLSSWYARSCFPQTCAGMSDAFLDRLQFILYDNRGYWSRRGTRRMYPIPRWEVTVVRAEWDDQGISTETLAYLRHHATMELNGKR